MSRTVNVLLLSMLVSCGSVLLSPLVLKMNDIEWGQLIPL